MEMIITDLQILSTIICAAISFVAWKVKVPPISIIPAIGFFIIGFQLYDASKDLLILGLYFFMAIMQSVLCFGAGESRRR